MWHYCGAQTQAKSIRISTFTLDSLMWDVMPIYMCEFCTRIRHRPYGTVLVLLRLLHTSIVFVFVCILGRWAGTHTRQMVWRDVAAPFQSNIFYYVRCTKLCDYASGEFFVFHIRGNRRKSKKKLVIQFKFKWKKERKKKKAKRNEKCCNLPVLSKQNKRSVAAARDADLKT